MQIEGVSPSEFRCTRVPFFGQQAELPRRLTSQTYPDILIGAFTKRSFGSHEPQ